MKFFNLKRIVDNFSLNWVNEFLTAVFKISYSSFVYKKMRSIKIYVYNKSFFLFRLKFLWTPSISRQDPYEIFQPERNCRKISVIFWVNEFLTAVFKIIYFIKKVKICTFKAKFIFCYLIDILNAETTKIGNNLRKRSS